LSSGAGQQAHHEQNPVQKFGTAGIKPMGRPTLVTRIFMRVVSWSERLNLAFSKVGNPPIYDNAIFPWTRLIENEWRLIRAELERVLTRKDELPASMSCRKTPQRSAGTIAGRVLSWRPMAFARRTISAHARKHGESVTTFRDSSA
jgi:hypothetical protein